MTDRIRAALEVKPETLWELLESFRKKPPLIAGRWEPSNASSHFFVTRKDTNRHGLVEISRPLPDAGPWEMKSIGRVGDRAKSRLARLMNNDPSYTFMQLRELTDAILEEEGWSLLHTKYPDTSFNPWVDNATDSRKATTAHRPWASEMDALAPRVQPLAVPDGRMKYEFTVPIGDGKEYTGKAWSFSVAKRWADEKLVSLGFDLATPDAYDLTAMRLEYDARQAKTKADREKTDQGMKRLQGKDGKALYIDEKGNRWVETKDGKRKKVG
jgi:hypothetical protein